jgi:membrane-bound metal-dependent hydrolase YbcI (DUF457 family)
MAAFREHLIFSSLLGGGYAGLLHGAGIETTHAVLAGGVCGLSGILPDLDSDSGKPIRELFGLTAVIVPLLLMQRMRDWGLTGEQTILAAAGLYLAIRFGASWVFRHLTVHRGMFHSIPAALLVAEIVLLAHDSPGQPGNLALAGGAFLGFVSHLLLDDIYGLKHLGTSLRGMKAPERGLKFTSRSRLATVTTWLLLGAVTYCVGIRQGYLQPIQLPASLQRVGWLTGSNHP